MSGRMLVSAVWPTGRRTPEAGGSTCLGLADQAADDLILLCAVGVVVVAGVVGAVAVALVEFNTVDRAVDGVAVHGVAEGLLGRDGGGVAGREYALAVAEHSGAVGLRFRQRTNKRV